MSEYSISVSAAAYAKLREIANPTPDLRTRWHCGRRIVPVTAALELVCADILRDGAK